MFLRAPPCAECCRCRPPAPEGKPAASAARGRSLWASRSLASGGASEDLKLRVKVLFLPAPGLWANDSAPLCLGFLTFEMEIIRAPTPSRVTVRSK